jgi:hypothetical protein
MITRRSILADSGLAALAEAINDPDKTKGSNHEDQAKRHAALPQRAIGVAFAALSLCLSIGFVRKLLRTFRSDALAGCRWPFVAGINRPGYSAIMGAVVAVVAHAPRRTAHGVAGPLP